MNDPWNMNVDQEQWIGDFQATGTDPGEPLTPTGAGSCPDGSWQLDRTTWFAFAATGGDVVTTIDSGVGSWGMAMYLTNGTPTLSNLVTCTHRQRIQIKVIMGERLLVQVGTLGTATPPPTGAFSVSRLATNDKRDDAIPLSYDKPVTIKNFGATLDPGELSTCATGQGWHGPGERSVWAYVDVSAPGTLLLDLEDFLDDTRGDLAVYGANDSTPIGCSTQTVPPYQRGTQLQVPVSRGRYWVQVLRDGFFQPLVTEAWWTLEAKFTPNLDVDADGFLKPTDCDDDDATIHPGALDVPEDGVDQDCSGADAVNFDRDADTYQRPGDCDDANRSVHPGAVETPDDGVDQNCDGRDDRRDSDRDGIPDYKDRCPQRSSGGVDVDGDGCRDPIQLVVTAQLSLSLLRRALHLESLTVRSARGVHIVVTCSKHACERETTKLGRSFASMGDRFAARVPVGAVVTIRATKAGALGMVKQYRLSARGVRLVRQWCTSAGTRPKRIRCA